MHEHPPVSPVESQQPDPAADEVFAQELLRYENDVPSSIEQANETVERIRERASGMETHADGTATLDEKRVSKGLVEELQDRASVGLDAWRLSNEDRAIWKEAASATSWADLTPPMQNYMKSLKKDVYQPMGMVFADLQSQAEKRLALDDQLRNPLPPQAPAVEVPQQAAPKPRAMSRANRSDLEALANARSRDEASSVLNREDLPKNSPLRKLELSPIDTKRPTSALEGLRAVRENAREQLAQDDATKAQLSQERATVRREAAHEKELVEQREQWKADAAAVAKAEQGILNSWKFKHGGEAGLKHELARKGSDLMERVQRQARARVLGGDEKAVSQPAQPRSAEVILPSATQHEENKKTVEGLNNFYRQHLLGSAAVAGQSPDARTTGRTLEAHGRFTNQDFLQFNDGEIGLSFSEPGTQIVLGADALHKYARNFGEGGDDMALVYTQGGGKYGLADGKVIDMRTGEVTSLPDDSLGFTIGDKFTMPGSTDATVIEEVLLRYKVASEPLSGAEQVKAPSPFKALDELLKDDQTKSSTNVMPLVPVVAAAPQPNVQKAPAPEKRKGRRRALIMVAGALALTAALAGGLTAMNAEDAPHKEAGQNTHDLTDEEQSRADDMRVEQGRMVEIEVEPNNGPTQEIKQLAAKQGIKASPQQFYDSYKKFANQGRFDNIEGMYRMANGDFGFASAGAHELPADLVNDILEDLKKSTK